MKILIDNNQRVFLINRNGFSARFYFCNLHHIPEILKNDLERNDTFTISEYWNFKFKRCSKKHINDMFEANKIDYKIK